MVAFCFFFVVVVVKFKVSCLNFVQLRCLQISSQVLSAAALKLNRFEFVPGVIGLFFVVAL